MHCDTTVARMLVGNKCDLGNIRAVSIEQGKMLAEEHMMFFMETSAKDSTNVKNAFEMVVGELYFKIDSLGEGAKWRRTIGQRIYSPFLLAFSEQDGDNSVSDHVTTFCGIDPSYSLLDNVAILTLQELADGITLLLLAHLYEVGEDEDLSVLTTVELKKLFPHKKECINRITPLESIGRLFGVMDD